MQTDALNLARDNEGDVNPERLSWGVVQFQVTDLDRAVTFWSKALGLCVRDQGNQWVALGTLTKTMFVFHNGASRAVSPSYTGMYHVAIGVPDQQEFSRYLSRLSALHVSVSPVDHLMAKSMYLTDPDGLEIEITLETPERFSRFGEMSRNFVLYDIDGHTHNGREQLDIAMELSHARNADLLAPMSDEAFLAHIHFKVSDLELAATWFEGIGFARNLMLPHIGFADMGAGAPHTHRLAMNIWAGANLTPTPVDMARLTHYALHLQDPTAIDKSTGLLESENCMTGTDPTGAKITIGPVT